jgi:hypothetical protein
MMKRGAKPTNDAWYIQQVVQTTTPEALTSPGVKIAARWQVGTIDQMGAMMHALSQFGNDVGDTAKYDLTIENFSDADGDGGMVLVAYHKQ